MAQVGIEPQGPAETLDAAVGRLLKAQEEPRSLRWLARQLEKSPGFISRAIRSADGKAASPELLTRVAMELGVAPEWFAAVREARVLEAVRHDSQLRERLFRELDRGQGPTKR